MKRALCNVATRMRLKILGLLQIVAAYVVVYWVFRGAAGVRVDRSAIKGVKPPFIVLGNHTSNLDPALVQYAIARYPCYFLTSNFYFRHQLIGKILNLFGAIPKIQFAPDIRSTRGALATIARGDIVGIFPEGRRSIDGHCCTIPDSIAKLIKKVKVPVVFVKTNGGYFVWPRWSSSFRSGRVETVVERILTTDEICTLDTKELHSIVCRTLEYNEYDWNKDAKVRYFHKNAAEQLHLILHQCPRCFGERSMRSKETRLYCITCGNTAILNEYGFLQPLDDECVVFDDPVKWNAWQRQNIFRLVQDDAFQMQATVKELRVADRYYGSYRSCGGGQLILSVKGLYFKGKVDGKTTELFFSIEMIPTISTEFQYDFEICDDKNAWWIFLEEEQQTIRLESAIAILYQRIAT